MLAEISKKIVSPEELVNDVEHFIKVFMSTHPNPYIRLTHEEIMNSKRKLIEKISQVDREEGEFLIREFIAKIGDMHTSTLGIDEVYRIPFRVRKFSQEFRIVEVNQENKQLLGCGVISIGGIGIGKIFNKIKRIVPYENEIYRESMGTEMMSSVNTLRAVGVPIKDELVEVMVEDEQGKVFSCYIKAVMKREKLRGFSCGREVQYICKNVEAPYWYRYHEESESIYIKYNVCMDHMYASKVGMYRSEDYPDYYDFIENIYNSIEEKLVSKVILDIRGNSGGAMKYPKYLFLKLLESEKWNTELNKKNHFYVFIDEEVVSAGVELCCYLKKNTKASFIGRETGGNIKVYGGRINQNRRLPNSGIVFICADSEDCSGYDEIEKNFKPDVDIKVSFQQIKNGVDPLMEFALGEK